MQRLLVATDSDHLLDQVDASLGGGGREIRRVTAGAEVDGAARTSPPDLVILDMQIGAMGGFATCVGLRQEQEAGRLPDFPILLLLDREADVFLARQSGADDWVIKPLDPLQLDQRADILLAD